MLDSYLNIATHPLLWIFLGLTAVFLGVQWLVGHPLASPTAPDERIKRLAERVGMKGLHPVLFLILLLTWGLVAATLFVGLYAILWQVVFHAPPEGAENVWDWRFTLAQLVALTTVLGAVIALPITINRLILTRRQTDTVEQGHITDQINKAVEELGTVKAVRVHRKDSTGNFLFHEREGSEGDTKSNLDYKRPVAQMAGRRGELRAAGRGGGLRGPGSGSGAGVSSTRPGLDPGPLLAPQAPDRGPGRGCPTRLIRRGEPRPTPWQKTGA